ncbi:MAG: DUF3795 domain-containing protein, partial [Chloroflexi bacterium]|nr:DUF3795 domain-containing protein [Chloroflexota bacterium]
MSIGPCGQACSVCGFHVKGLCEGCLPGDRCPPEKAARQQCPVLFCASSRRIAFCSRDCPQYPCHLYALHLAPCPPRRGFQPAPRPNLLLAQQMVQVEWPALRMFCLGRFRVARQEGVVADNEWGQKKGPT